MILLSPGGTSVQRGERPGSTLVVGTTEGVFVFERSGAKQWSLRHRALEGSFVSALTRLKDGALIAGTHGLGVAKSDDGGTSWRLVNSGLTHFDVWVVKAERLGGRERLFAGTLPAHLFVSDDGGASWTELAALTRVPSAPRWSFPPPPHQAHVLDVAVHGKSLYVGIEVGALLRSDDAGATFVELPVNPDASEVDIHRLALHPKRPQRIIAATGWGMIASEDGGDSWRGSGKLPGIDYPIPLVAHPDDPDLLFVAGGEGWPPNWYRIGRSRAKVARSRDGGKTWQRLLGGLPDGQRANYGGLALDAWDGGFAVYAADTDGQIYESADGGERWSVVAEAAPVSKGEQYRGLAKGRPALVGTDSLVFSEAGQRRIDSAVM
ncbi:MAG: hypothetical protein A3D95_10485 [Betaproteobacteria bacterium RIFCSPHIGHO2_12_FULL_69_13]|nr:MAG: hypothetical protein A3D95_10485 [Betaproteobacteria bacterium RIFCSPHIGHO2_12_FULL_69_13]OGA66610.1 MAG: hypothetical protein A3G83_18030 [Betaproteobacteria bacterium RIFCSPLOWO2_12_FULL_68_20]